MMMMMMKTVYIHTFSLNPCSGLPLSTRMHLNHPVQDLAIMLVATAAAAAASTVVACTQQLSCRCVRRSRMYSVCPTEAVMKSHVVVFCVFLSRISRVLLVVRGVFSCPQQQGNTHPEQNLCTWRVTIKEDPTEIVKTRGLHNMHALSLMMIATSVHAIDALNLECPRIIDNQLHGCAAVGAWLRTHIQWMLMMIIQPYTCVPCMLQSTRGEFFDRP